MEQQWLDAQHWMEKAHCSQAPFPDDWFAPNDSKETAYAKGVCMRCQVATECLKYANDNNHWDGIWGGLTAQERRQLR